MASDTYKTLMQQCADSRQEALAFAQQFLVKADYRMATMNLSSAVVDSMTAAHAEWRLGTADPSPYLRDAVADAREVARYFDKLEYFGNKLENAEALGDAMYAQLLLQEPIRPEFRRCCFVPPEEKRHPTLYEAGWLHPWDMLVLELVETGSTPSEWDEFMAWLRGRGGASNLLKTMQAYKDLIDAARIGNRDAAAKAIATTEKRFKARRHLGLTWGGGDIADQTVDHRLACAIEMAEQIRPGITASADTPHRWRWP